MNRTDEWIRGWVHSGPQASRGTEPRLGKHRISGFEVGDLLVAQSGVKPWGERDHTCGSGRALVSQTQCHRDDECPTSRVTHQDGRQVRVRVGCCVLNLQKLGEYVVDCGAGSERVV